MLAVFPASAQQNRDMRSEVTVDYRALEMLGPSPSPTSSVPSRPTLRTYAASPTGQLLPLQGPISGPRAPLTAGASTLTAIPPKPSKPAKQTAAASLKKPAKPKIKTTPAVKPEPPTETAESDLTPPPPPTPVEPPPEVASSEELPPPPEMAVPEGESANAGASGTASQPEVAAESQTPPPPPEVPANSEPPPAPAGEASPPAADAMASAEAPPAPAAESAETSQPAEQAQPEKPAQTASLPPAEGQLRIQFTEGSAELPDSARQELGALAQKLSANEAMRIQLLAYASGTADTASRARRMSLSRALAVRSYLIGQGVRSTRMDVRALGNNVQGEPADRVDIIPQSQ